MAQTVAVDIATAMATAVHGSITFLASGPIVVRQAGFALRVHIETGVAFAEGETG